MTQQRQHQDRRARPSAHSWDADGGYAKPKKTQPDHCSRVRPADNTATQRTTTTAKQLLEKHIRKAHTIASAAGASLSYPSIGSRRHSRRIRRRSQSSSSPWRAHPCSRIGQPTAAAHSSAKQGGCDTDAANRCSDSGSDTDPPRLAASALFSFARSHIFGLKADVSGGIQYLEDNCVIYPAGHNIVLYSTDTKTQRFIHGR